MPTSGRSKNYSNMELLWWNFSSEKQISYSWRHQAALFLAPTNCLSGHTGMADGFHGFRNDLKFPQVLN